MMKELNSTDEEHLPVFGRKSKLSNIEKAGVGKMNMNGLKIKP